MTTIARKCVIKGCSTYHRSRKGTCIEHRKIKIDKNQYTVNELMMSFGRNNIPKNLYVYPDSVDNKIKDD